VHNKELAGEACFCTSGVCVLACCVRMCMCSCMLTEVELVMLQLLPCACRACHCCTCTAFAVGSVLLCCLLLTVHEQAARRKVTVLPGDVCALPCA
jgi:hypothetical protein